MQHLALLVDDDTHTLFFMEQILRPTGMTILKAGDGIQALEILQDYTPDIIFLDMLMPRVGGLEVLSFIMESPHLNQTLVVVVSSQNRGTFGSLPQLDRADAYFVKPVKAAAMLDIARQAIGCG